MAAANSSSNAKAMTSSHRSPMKSGALVDNEVHNLVMTDPIYVGIAVTSHEAGNLGAGYFENVEFTGNLVSVSNWMVY